ncbi:unnamed protein product [Urochloa humidicola]
MTMASPASPWSDEILPELLGRVIAELLPFPADIARFRAVCRAWRSAARQHVRQLPWIVLPDASFCTIAGDDGGLVHRIPGLPDNVICLGTAADGWLALDCTDDLYRRTPYRDKFVDNNTFPRPRAGAMHRHTYMLHNPFSGETVPLPELDAIVGHVTETFDIRKVLMRSSSPDDVVAVATNNWDCNVILCRPGKGRSVVPYLRICDIVFHGGKLYGITPEEELVAIDLSEDEDGRPIVTKYKRVIMQQLADGQEDPWSWMYSDDDNNDNDEDDDDDDDEDDDNDSDDDEESDNAEEESDDEASNQEEEDSRLNSGDIDDNSDDELSSIDDDDNSDDDEEDEEDGEESSDDDDDEAPNQEVEYSLNGDGKVPDGEEVGTDDTVSYKPKDHTSLTRRLVESCEGRDLLMVRHHMQVPPYTSAYTRKVEVFKADIEGGKWVPVTTDALAQGEALFLSRPFSKCTRAYGDIEEGFIYFMDMDDVFDTRSWTRRPLSLPPRWRREDEKLLTWFFPPELVL